MGARFPPQARVRAKSEFGQVFEHGRRVGTPLLTLHYLADADSAAGTHLARSARLGLAVSRKVDPHAVGRNRIKRRLRDYFRRRRDWLVAGAYVVVARNSAAAASGPELLAAFEQALKRSGALPANAPPCTMPPAPSRHTFASTLAPTPPSPTSADT
jgi:ribonuclease P protein component